MMGTKSQPGSVVHWDGSRISLFLPEKAIVWESEQTLLRLTFRPFSEGHRLTLASPTTTSGQAEVLRQQTKMMGTIEY